MSSPPPRSESPGPFAFLTRRRFLVAFLALAGSGVATGVSVDRLLRGGARDPGGLRLLGAGEYRTLHALTEVLFPLDGPLGVDPVAFDLPRSFDGFLADEPERNRRDLRTALALIELGPLLFDHRLTTFSRMPADDRALHWRSWGESDSLLRRKVSVAFRRFFHTVFYDRPEVAQALGYPGPTLAALRSGAWDGVIPQ